MTVDLPVRPGQPVALALAPGANGLMRRSQSLVWAVVNHCGRQAVGRGRTNDIATLAEGSGEFNPHLEVDIAVEVDRHVSTTSQFLASQIVPDQATAARNDGGQLGRPGATPHDGEGDRIDLC